MAANGHRQLPQNLEAEMAILGAIMLVADGLDRVAEIVTAEDFYSPRNALVFEACRALAERGEPRDIVTVTEQLRASGKLAEAGGATYLSEVLDRTVSAVHTEHYARIVRDKALLRRAIRSAQEIIDRASSPLEDVAGFIDDAERMMFELAQRRSRRAAVRVGDTVIEYNRELEERGKRRQLTGLPTGFADLDDMVGGLQASDLVVLAARPGHGKSALALNIAEHVSVESAVPAGVLVFSLEMSFGQLRDRLWASQARVELQRLRLGRFEMFDYPKIAQATGRIEPAQLWIDDSPALSPLELRARARRIAADRRVNLGLVVVDYLQLMRASRQDRSREQEVSEISQSLKALAKELRVPVLALCQLNREVEKRTPPKPKLSDLRDSGQIEQDADVVMFLFRSDVNQPDRTKHDHRAELSIAKQRNGPTGKLDLFYRAECTRFESLDPRGGEEAA